MLLMKVLKNRKRLKIVLALILIGLVALALVVISATQNGTTERVLDAQFVARAYAKPQVEHAKLLKSPQHNGVIWPEKYDEQKVRARIIEDKIKSLKQLKSASDAGDEHTVLATQTTAIHIFYTAPVPWYKTKKNTQLHIARQLGNGETNNAVENVVTPNGGIISPTIKSVRILNTAFYPALGLYKPTPNLLQKHFENISKCGIGVLILSYMNKPGETEVIKQILELAPSYNLSVTFELSVASNQSVAFLRQQLLDISRYASEEGFYRVYSHSQQRLMPMLYVSNAYKLSDSAASRLLCHSHPETLRRILDAYYIGHIRLKNHAETMRRQCFEGFYTKLPSNGATFATTWKNWSYLKSFATTYKMLFVPTVGPGFAERNKFPRHGDIQRHRSNGRYYGVAWRTAIINHVGIINIASYNNWPDGSQIEEVIPKAGFLDYNPGSKTKYLDLTAHWVGNFLKTRYEAILTSNGQLNCNVLLNNTIC